MSELQQKSRWYTEDILYIIAEKLLARIPDEGQIDFCRQNPYTLFMSHNEMAFRTIISQFAKFKRIHFTRDGYVEQIEFYKKGNFNDSEMAEFGGPYIVPKGMLEYIIEKGKFRVNTIETDNFLWNDHSTDIKEFGEMNSLEAFCALFLGKHVQIPDGLNTNLMVKRFNVNESAVIIQNNLEAILAIDAVELTISNDENIIFDCSQYKNTIIAANNTTKITVESQFNFQSSKDNEKFAANFESFCSFLVRVCPTLKYLQIKICSSIDYIYSIEFFDNFYATIKSIEANIKLIKIGNEHLQISIELIANNVLTDIFDRLRNHDLFKVGTAFTVENAEVRYIARSLECVDIHSRIHKMLIKILEDDYPTSEYAIDSDDDYDYEDDEDEEEEEDSQWI